MSGRMPRRMQDFDASFSKVDVTHSRLRHSRPAARSARPHSFGRPPAAAETRREAKPAPLRAHKNRGNICVRRYDPNERVWRRP